MSGSSRLLLLSASQSPETSVRLISRAFKVEGRIVLLLDYNHDVQRGLARGHCSVRIRFVRRGTAAAAADYHKQRRHAD